MLQADCSNCAALCCMALAFDKSDLFGVDKPAGIPCQHLHLDDKCGIHDGLTDRGFSGCVSYDCLGAGQRVTQQVFGGKSWRDNPDLARPMFEAFRIMRKVQELLQLLETADMLPLTGDQQDARVDLVVELSPADGWDMAGLERFERLDINGDVQEFLQGLQEHALR